jgi:soluble lytic murein transglycosylase-like protein
VQQVRSGLGSEDAAERGVDSSDTNDESSQSNATSSRDTRKGDSGSRQTREPHESTSKDPDEPQASLRVGSGEIDRASYLMVVRWAKANRTPVSLALGVAWMESHMNPHPTRGAAGEMGMFQILPERCTLEGWPARRLKEPEFNAWLGTLLLSRYYQEEGSVARAAAKYVAGPGVFDRKYSKDVWTYINWYASTVDSYASYFSRYQT